MKIGIEGGNWTAEYYEATVVSVVDYYPFGSAMAGRKYNQGTYRYGFNGKEEDKEWGSQMIQDYGFRIYNPTIGKFLSVDPLMASYPMLTPYQFAHNRPIVAIDLDGLEAEDTNEEIKESTKNQKTEYKGGAILNVNIEDYQGKTLQAASYLVSEYTTGKGIKASDFDYNKLSEEDQKKLKYWIEAGGGEEVQTAFNLVLAQQSFLEKRAPLAYKEYLGSLEKGSETFSDFEQLSLVRQKIYDEVSTATIAASFNPTTIGIALSAYDGGLSGSLGLASQTYLKTFKKATDFVNSVSKGGNEIWGMSAGEIAVMFRRAGYNATVKQSTQGSQKSLQISVGGHKYINRIQVHPGGGTKAGSYYKISTSKGVVKIINPSTYKLAKDREKAMFIHYKTGKQIFPYGQ